MCARAPEPTDQHKACNLALKHITAVKALSVSPGAASGLIALVVETNKAFEDMVDDKFPTETMRVKPPMHVGLGELHVKEGGMLSLNKEAIGTLKVFYDMTKAAEEGYFGTEPVIWKAQEMHVVLELLSSGLDLEGEEWDKYVHHPTMWCDSDAQRSRCTRSQQQGLEQPPQLQA